MAARPHPIVEVDRFIYVRPERQLHSPRLAAGSSTSIHPRSDRGVDQDALLAAPETIERAEPLVLARIPAGRPLLDPPIG